MFDDTFDVIIAGTGAAAGGAAFGSLLGGAKKVLVCEKSLEDFGGTTKNAILGWLWCPNNKFLSELGVRNDPEDIVKLLVNLAEESEEDHMVDDGDLELIKAFSYEWEHLLQLLEEKKVLVTKLEDARSDEDKQLLEKLYWQKLQQKPDECKSIGLSKNNVSALSNLLPSYCAENDLDLCPTGMVLSSTESSTMACILKLFEDHKNVFDVRKGFEVVDLIFDMADENKVVGAIVHDRASDQVLRFGASKGVFFGTGGFSRNPNYMSKYLKAEFHGTCAGSENTGDLITISQKHEIGIYGMDEAWLKQVVIPEDMENRFPGIFFHNCDSFIIVNKHGKRFANEKDFYQQRGRMMYQNQDELKVVIAVFDSRTVDLHQGPVMSLGGPIPYEHCSDDCMVSGNTFTELVDNLRIFWKKHVKNLDLSEDFEDQLKRQVSKFNVDALKGRDSEFGRGENVAAYCWHTPRRQNEYANKTMHPIDTSNLRAMLIGLSTLDTRGGPRTTANGEIYRNYETAQIIKGLYGAGNCVKSFAKHSYPASGITISSALFFGYKSGLHAMSQTQPKL